MFWIMELASRPSAFRHTASLFYGCCSVMTIILPVLASMNFHMVQSVGSGGGASVEPGGGDPTPPGMHWCQENPQVSWFSAVYASPFACGRLSVPGMPAGPTG